MTEENLASLGNIMISYSRRNLGFVRKLYDSFVAAGLEESQIWVDWEDIPLSADWMAEITKGIREADSIVFVQSPDSLSSQVCGEELDLAEANHKRMIVIEHIAPTADNTIHPALQNVPMIAMPSIESIPEKINEVMAAASKDLAYLQAHTRMQVRAVDWQTNDDHHDLLLRGEDISEGETWLVSATDKDPRPTGLQGEYLLASREYQTVVDRRRMFWLAGFVLAAIIALVIASFQFVGARAAETLAEENTNLAETESAFADFQAQTAVAAGATAVEERNIATTKEALAEAGATQEAIALFEAETQQSIANTQEAKAHIESTLAAIAAETAVSALATSVAEANARATQQAIAEAETVARKTQQAIAVQEAEARATQEAITQAEIEIRMTQEVIAQTNSTQAAIAKATEDAEARLANALTLASTALQLQYTDPQLARLLILLAVKETQGLLPAPSDTVKAALVEIASNPLLKDLDVADGNTRDISIEITAAGKLLTHDNGSSNIYQRNLITGAIEATYPVGFSAYEFGLDPNRTRMIAFNDTQVAYWPDVTSSTHSTITAGASFNKLVDFSIYPPTDQLVLLSANDKDSQIVGLYDISGAVPVFQDSQTYDESPDVTITEGVWEQVLLTKLSASTYPEIFTIGNDGSNGQFGWVFPLASASDISPAGKTTITRHSFVTNKAVLTPDYKHLVLGTSILAKFYEYPGSSTVKIFSGHEGDVWGVAFSKSSAAYSNPALAISVGRAGVAQIYDYDGSSLTVKTTYNHAHTTLVDVIIYPDESYYIVSTDAGEIMWYDLNETAAADYLSAITELEGELLSNTLDATNCTKYAPVSCTYASINSRVVQNQSGQGGLFVVFSLLLSITLGGILFLQSPTLKNQKK